MSAVQILIADDHELFRRTVRSFIESQPNWRVCGDAGDGVERAASILRELPECKVIIVTQNPSSISRQQAAAVNAHAYVTKSDLTKDLPVKIDSVLGHRNLESTL